MNILQIILSTLLYEITNGYKLHKCCPEGYSIDQNFGYKNPSEFKKNNLHCRNDPEIINWVPEFFYVDNTDKIVPNENEFYSIGCDVYDFAVFNFDYQYDNFGMVNSRGFIIHEYLNEENGDLNITVGYEAMSVAQNYSLKEESYCLDVGFYSHLPVIMTCACPIDNCVQYCCGASNQIGEIDRGGNFVCNPTTLTTQWDAEVEKFHLAPSHLWIPAFAQYWRHRCKHSSHGFTIHEEHELEDQSITVLKYHKMLQTSKFDIDSVDAHLTAGRHRVDSHMYCLAPILDEGELKTNAFYCDLPEFVATTNDVILQSWFAGIGAIFTLATLTVHSLLPELRRGIKGISLMCHCTFMLIAYLGLAIRPYIWSVDGESCLQLAYVLQFALLSAFFWLNIRAIFIFTRFRSMETMLSRLSNKGHSAMVYPLCALYACAVPALVCLITWLAQPYSSHASRLIWRDGLTLMEDHPEAPSWLLTPDLDDTSCWFATSLGRTLYFSLPMGLVLLANLFMFISTVCKLIALTKGRTVHSKDDLQSDRRRLFLFAKMFVLMGLTWSGEFISFANYLSQYYWYFSTVAMSLRAASVFILFCCKQKVWEDLKSTLRCNCVKKEVDYKKDQMNEFTKDSKDNTIDINIIKTKDSITSN